MQLDFGALLKEPSLREEMRQFVRRRVERLQERRARLLRHALHPTHVLLRDKLTFVAGTFDLLISAYWLGWRCVGRLLGWGVDPVARCHRRHVLECVLYQLMQGHAAAPLTPSHISRCWPRSSNPFAFSQHTAHSYYFYSLPIPLSARSPDSFYRLYTAKAAVLFIARWVYYRMKKWHYYLLGEVGCWAVGGQRLSGG